MKKLAPYQLFFPLGLFCCMLAVGVWFVQDLAWFSTPTILIHARLIVGGFLWSFIVGFLMTAVPRMTGAASANFVETTLAIILIGAQIIGSWVIDPRWFYAATIALIFFIIIFAIRRLLSSTKEIPVFFSHVGLGMLAALMGALAYYGGNTFLGIHLYHLGTILLLVLGIGTRFFSFLSGLQSEFENVGKIPRMLFHFLGLCMVGLLF